MNHDIVPHKTPRALARQGLRLPAIIDDAGDHASRKFVEFFVARIRNKNTLTRQGGWGAAALRSYVFVLNIFIPLDQSQLLFLVATNKFPVVRSIV